MAEATVEKPSGLLLYQQKHCKSNSRDTYRCIFASGQAQAEK
jgi:hypothetical protein